MSISNIESLKNLYAKISGNSVDSINPKTIREAIDEITKVYNGGGAGGDYVHNYTTFDDLGIDTHGKTVEEILKEIADMNLPVNTIITGQLYTEAALAEKKIKIILTYEIK